MDITHLKILKAIEKIIGKPQVKYRLKNIFLIETGVVREHSESRVSITI